MRGLSSQIRAIAVDALRRIPNIGASHKCFSTFGPQIVCP